MSILPDTGTIRLEKSYDGSEYSIADVAKRPETAGPIVGSSIEIEPRKPVFLIDRSRLPAGVIPQNGDTITDWDGNRYVIDSVVNELAQTKYRCFVTELPPKNPF